MTPKQEQMMYYFFFLWIGFLFFWNLWFNDIWNPNEAFYAEAVREMFQNHNFLDIYYNYEPRFNKPPMTYWLIALSGAIFGLTEFAVRLPIALAGIGTVLLTFLIGRTLFSQKVALLSAFVVSFSIQFFINSRYASPEIPLTFFFTLTMYLFIKGYKSNQWKYIFWSYISLGLVMLTKGYPYLFVIGGIVIVYLFADTKFKLKDFWEKFKFLKIHIGLPVALIIGMWWFVYMYMKFGDSFMNVYMEETLHRALGHREVKLTDYFFYLGVILWGFLPYSFAFYYAIVGVIKDKKYLKDISFALSWIGVMFVVFTIAKGKIPTYFIQAHIPMAILVAYFTLNYTPKNIFSKTLWILTFILAGLLFMGMEAYLVYQFDLDKMYYVILLFPVLYAFRYKDFSLFPFNSALITFFVLVVSILPIIEKYRPYDIIGKRIEQKHIPTDIPLRIEDRMIHNLTFYAKRKVLRDQTEKQLLEAVQKGKFLALITDKSIDKFQNKGFILWIGWIYKKGSESRFAILLKNVLKAEKGDYSGFEKFYLVYKP